MLFAALLCVLIVLPMSWLVYYSLVDRTGAFTLDNFKTPGHRSDLRRSADHDAHPRDSARASSAARSPRPMGWLVARTDMPLRRTVRALVTASFVTPPFLGAIAWELLAAPNSGLLNQLYRARDRRAARTSICSTSTRSAGLIFVISCYTFPYVFVLVANALDRMPGDLEDASSILGGRTWTTARRITIPLALPALLAGALVAFLQAMTLFGSPAILAHAGRLPHHDHQDLEPVPVSAQAGAGGGGLAAAAGAHGAAAARRAHDPRPARLCGGRRQAGRSAPDPARRAANGWRSRFVLRRAADARCSCPTARCSTPRSRASPRSSCRSRTSPCTTSISCSSSCPPPSSRSRTRSCSASLSATIGTHAWRW